MNKKESILNAAKSAFVEKGYHQTTMHDISSKLNIKRTTLYDYFRSKEEIVFALIENMYEKHPIKSTQGLTLDRLADLCYQMLKRTEENLDLYRILFIALPVLDESAKSKVSLWQMPYNLELTDIFTDSSLSLEKSDDVKRLFHALLSQIMSEYISKVVTANVHKDIQYIMNIVERIYAYE